MKILFATRAADGHVNPLTGIAIKIAAGGRLLSLAVVDSTAERTARM